MFKKILIANRGEIAVRIASTLQQMGIKAVAVYSDPDRASPHAAAADEAYPLPGKTSSETYLQGAKIIEIAKTHGVEAIHPGYGFLAENAEFAEMCAAAGLTFIGPKPDAIRAMGDKINAKRAFAAAGVPVVPGWAGEASQVNNDASTIDQIAKEASRIGYPVLIKAAAGGGGKGMRIVHANQSRDRKGAVLPAQAPPELIEAIESAQREAKAAFGDSRVFIEKYIERPRHVEFQIFGDNHGNVVHLFERECSIQRRHQKIVEESPSPALTPELRQRMGEAAVRAAKAVGYTNAGTVEFMVDAAGNFYFLEVNTRLQVEHPVTEMIVHHDLVRAQVLVAAGEPLPFTQDDLRQDGHALECRIYAEDAAKGFMPSIGTLRKYIPPVGPNIRVDSGVVEGGEVSVYYDPMLAKLITWGRNRPEAIDRVIWALERFVVMGVTTNIEFLRNLMDHPEFRAGRLHTQFLQEHGVPAAIERATPDEAFIAAALAARQPRADRRPAGGDDSQSALVSPWTAGHAWRNV